MTKKFIEQSYIKGTTKENPISKLKNSISKSVNGLKLSKKNKSMKKEKFSVYDVSYLMDG